MTKSIILTFCDMSNDRLEHTIEIQEDKISTFKLFEITNALSLKHNEFIPRLVVGQFYIAIDNDAKIFESFAQFEDIKLEEIEILEDGKVTQSFSVRLDKDFEMFAQDEDSILRQLK